MFVDVILRCHDRGDVHTYAPRIIGPKSEVVRRSVLSLTESLKEIDHNVTIINDRCGMLTTSFLHDHGHVVTPYHHGNNGSMAMAVAIACESKADLVYMVEDDYLHYPSAISEMVGIITKAKDMGMKEVAVHPYDDFDNYHNLMPCTVVDGDHRHWRTNEYTTFTVMCRPDVIRQHRTIWDDMAHGYEIVDGIHENTTINKIWRKSVTLFTPLPSVAIHLNHNIPPLVDWHRLWETYK